MHYAKLDDAINKFIAAKENLRGVFGHQSAAYQEIRLIVDATIRSITEIAEIIRAKEAIGKNILAPVARDNLRLAIYSNLVATCAGIIIPFAFATYGANPQPEVDPRPPLKTSTIGTPQEVNPAALSPSVEVPRPHPSLPLPPAAPILPTSPRLSPHKETKAPTTSRRRPLVPHEHGNDSARISPAEEPPSQDLLPITKQPLVANPALFEQPEPPITLTLRASSASCPKIGNLQYPPQARRERREAVVHLSVLVDSAGKIARVRPAKRTPPDFLEAAASSAKAAVCRPATRDGKPVESWITVTVAFKLEDQQMP